MSTPDNIDALMTEEMALLDRIPEADITAWLVARLKQLRAQGMPVHALSADVGRYNGGESWPVRYRGGWTLHGVLGSCAAHEPTIAHAAECVERKIRESVAGETADAVRERELLEARAMMERRAS